jgi:hypothetical protein
LALVGPLSGIVLGLDGRFVLLRAPRDIRLGRPVPLLS